MNVARVLGVAEKLRDELLSSEIFYALQDARVMIEWWRRDPPAFFAPPPVPELITQPISKPVALRQLLN